MATNRNINSIDDSQDNFVETDPLSHNTEENEEKKRTRKETCLYILQNVTVEPTMFLFVFGVLISILTSQNLNIEKACRVNLNFTTEICDALRDQTLGEQNEYERDVQRLVAHATSWKTYITATIPCALALFVGSWSDKTGHRKCFIAYVLTGQVLICINGIVNKYLLNRVSLEVFVLSEGIIDGLSGSWCVCFLTMFSYISVITTSANRTFRMGLINFSLTVGFPIGMGFGGILLKTIGYYGCYSLSGSLHILNLLYVLFVLKDPKRSPEQKLHDKQGVLHFFRTFFDLKNVKETLVVVFRHGPNNRRLRICIMLLVTSILFGPTQGELSVLYITTRYRFNWDQIRFSIFQAYNFITNTIGTIVSVTVFTKYLEWHDSVLGILSTFSKIAASFIYCFAPNERIFFIAPLVDFLNGTALLAMRSIVSKLVDPNEYGKVTSVFSLTETLMPLVYVPLYNQVYIATMETLPGAVFLMGAAMTLPAIVIFAWLFWEHRRNLRNKKEEEKNGIKQNIELNKIELPLIGNNS